jgi:cell division protein FtsL
MDPTMYIPLLVIVVLLIAGIIFYQHKMKREKYHLDEREEAIRSRQARQNKPRDQQ